MTDDRKEIAELLSRAAPELGGEVKARAMERMTRLGPPGPRLRLPRVATALGVAAVLLAVGFVPYSVTDSQARMASALAAAQRGAGSGEAPREPGTDMSDPKMAAEFYGRQAVEFVQRNCPGDPEMLMAAGLLAPDAEAGFELLRQAIRMDPRPVRHATYVQKLAMTGPKYLRPALIPVDPGASDLAIQVKQFREQPEFAKVPEALPARSVGAILQAIQAWRQVEPKNAVPPALRCWYLYGLHRDPEAFQAWQEAGRLPVVDSHQGETLHAVVALLCRMGMPQTTLHFYLFAGGNPLPSFTSQLRDDARIAVFEGRKAQLGGRPKQAIAWWNATIAVGRHMGESARWLHDYLVAGAIEGVGASPSWRRVQDGSTGLSGGPLLKGRYFHGPQHAFYVSQVGESADEAARDSLVRGRVRADLLAEAVQRSEWQDTPFLRAQVLLFLACFTVGMLSLFLLLYAGLSLRHRRAADEAGMLGWQSRLGIAVAGLVPAVAGGAALWRWMPNSSTSLALVNSFVGGLVLCVLMTLLVPLAAARRGRAPGARLCTAWRGHLRRVLPISVMLFTLVGLSLAMVGRHEQAQWIRDISSGRYSEMAWAIGLVGRDKWTHPTIPPDAWRAETPPG